MGWILGGVGGLGFKKLKRGTWPRTCGGSDRKVRIGSRLSESCLRSAHEPTAATRSLYLVPTRLECCGQCTGCFEAAEANSSRSFSFDERLRDRAAINLPQKTCYYAEMAATQSRKMSRCSLTGKANSASSRLNQRASATSSACKVSGVSCGSRTTNMVAC